MPRGGESEVGESFAGLGVCLGGVRAFGAWRVWRTTSPCLVLRAMSGLAGGGKGGTGPSARFLQPLAGPALSSFVGFDFGENFVPYGR